MVPDVPHRRRPRADGRGGAGEGAARLHAPRVSTCSSRTTIVENGLDIPLANTIIIENAERYGLSELYQLRGRVGRSNRRAYAYLLVPPDTELSEIARKRLAALQGIQRPGRGLQDRRARSGTARRGQSAGRRAARPHRRGRLRHVRADARRDGAGAEGRRSAARRSTRRSTSAWISAFRPSTSPTSTSACAPTSASPTWTRRSSGEGAGGAGRPLRSGAGRGSEPARVLTAEELAQKIGVENVDRRSGALNMKFHEQSKIDPNRLMELVSTTQSDSSLRRECCGCRFRTPNRRRCCRICERTCSDSRAKPGGATVLVLFAVLR